MEEILLHSRDYLVIRKETNYGVMYMVCDKKTKRSRYRINERDFTARYENDADRFLQACVNIEIRAAENRLAQAERKVARWTKRIKKLKENISND